jgi:DNA-binding transcriptional LysR family regulator
MRINQMDLNLLVVFDVIYTERNLTRAAEVLHITQPAVSNALSRLRKSFDDQLFVRTSDGMVPTPAARDLATPVRKALQLVENCIEEDSVFDPTTSAKTILCSFSDLAEALLLPGLLARLQTVGPNMPLRSYYVARNELPMELASGTLDIGVDVAYVNDTNLKHVPLLDEEYVCAVRNDHPTIKRKPTMAQYLAMGHIHVSSRRKGVGSIDQSLKALGERRTISARVRDYTAATLIVAQSDLAGTFPQVIANQAGLKTFPLPFETPPVSMHMYWHKSADSDPANAWLRKLLADVAQK